MLQLLKDCVISSEHEQAKQDMLNTNLFKDIRYNFFGVTFINTPTFVLEMLKNFCYSCYQRLA